MVKEKPLGLRLALARFGLSVGAAQNDKDMRDGE
jgi:hypothetical protein